MRRLGGWAVLLVLVVVASGLPAALSPGPGDVPSGAPTARSSAQLSLNGSGAPIVYLNQSLFWGVNDRATNDTAGSDPANYSDSPTTVIRWPGGALGDRWDYQAQGGAGVLWSTNVSQKPNSTPQYTMSDLNLFLENLSAQHDPQTLIVTLPAEINNVTQATEEVVYITRNLGLLPEYWEIGNEPGRWTHFNVPWPLWHLNVNSPVTPDQYALVVANYTREILRVDPTSKFIVWPGDGNGTDDAPWIQTVLAQDCGVAGGSQNLAVAIHVYPVGPANASESPTQFYGTLTDNRSLVARIPVDLAAIDSSCRGVPLFVDELGSATGNNLTAVMSSFEQVPYITAELDQAMILNVTNVDFFAMKGAYGGAWFGPTGAIRPTFYLYTDLLRYLPWTEAQNVTALTNATRGVWAVHTSNSTQSALLIANANASIPLRVDLASLGFPSDAPSEAITWNAASPQPISTGFVGDGALPNNWTLPAPAVAEFLSNSTDLPYGEIHSHPDGRAPDTPPNPSVPGESIPVLPPAAHPGTRGGQNLNVTLRHRSVTAHPPNGTISLGMSETYIAKVNGGAAGPDSLTWIDLPPGCPQNYTTASTTVACTPDPTYGGTFLSYVNVTDSAGDWNLSNNASTYIIPTGLTGGLDCAPNCSAELGSTVYLDATITPDPIYFSYTFTGLPPGCVSNDTPVVACTPTITGSWTVEVEISYHTATFLAITNVTVVPSVLPLAPTDLRAIGETSTSIALAWTNPPSGGLVNDTVWYGLPNASLSPVSTNGVVPSYTPTGLSPSTAYRIAVQAWDAAGGSPLSASIIVSTRGVVPSAPTGLSERGATQTSILLSWTNPVPIGLVNDTVWYGVTCPPAGPISLGGVADSYNLTGLSPGTSYCIAVQAYNATGGSPLSSPIYVSTNSTPSVPPAPTGLTLVPTSVTTTTLSFSWTNPPTGGLVNDTLWYGLRCGSFTSVSTGGVVSNFTLTGLSPGRTYCVVVQAYNATGGSPFSDPVLATTASVPPAPTDLHATEVTASTIMLAWNNPSVPGLLNDTAWFGPACPPSIPAPLGGVFSSWTLEGLSPNTTYCFAVQVYNATGGSALSALLEVTTTPPGTVPPAPTGLVETSASTTTLALEWTNPSTDGLVNDTVWYGTSCDALNGVSTQGVSSSFTLTGLLPATSYCVGIQAYNETGGSLLSSTITAWTLLPAPTGLVGSAENSSTISLAWTNPSVGGLVNDTVWFGPECGSLTPRSVGSAAASYTLAGLAPTTTYCIAVQADTSSETSPLSSPPIEVTTPAAVAPAPTVPAAPTGVTQTGGSTTTIALSWGNPTTGGLVNDTVWFGTSCQSRRSVSTDGPTTTYLLTGLSSATTYCIAVQAYNETGGSPLSASIEAGTATPPSPLLAPGQFRSIAETDASIALSWMDAPGTVNVTLLVRPAGCGSPLTTWSAGTAQEYNVTGLTPATTYCFEVAPWNTSSEGPAAFTNATTLAAAPVPVPSSSGAPGLSNVDWLAIGIALGAALVGGAVLLLRRRSGGSASAKPPEPEPIPEWKE